MTIQLRTGIVAGIPEVKLFGEVECDEVYVTAWKNILNNLRLIFQPLLLFWSIYL